MVVAKVLCVGEVRGSNPMDSNIILHNNQKPIKGCHVAAHDWATWHPITWPNNATCRDIICPQQPTKLCHIITCHVIVRSYDPATSSCTDCTISVIFFACLTLWTYCNISRSRCPFETKRVVLGLQRRGLRSHSIWSDSDHFEFLSKIWSPDQLFSIFIILNLIE